MYVTSSQTQSTKTLKDELNWLLNKMYIGNIKSKPKGTEIHSQEARLGGGGGMDRDGAS